jgi:hypothetical protein
MANANSRVSKKGKNKILWSDIGRINRVYVFLAQWKKQKRERGGEVFATKETVFARIIMLFQIRMD